MIITWEATDEQTETDVILYNMSCLGRTTVSPKSSCLDKPVPEYNSVGGDSIIFLPSVTCFLVVSHTELVIKK